MFFCSWATENAGPHKEHQSSPFGGESCPTSSRNGTNFWGRGTPCFTPTWGTLPLISNTCKTGITHVQSVYNFVNVYNQLPVSCYYHCYCGKRKEVDHPPKSSSIGARHTIQIGDHGFDHIHIAISIYIPLIVVNVNLIMDVNTHCM